MIKVSVFSEEKAWSKRLKNTDIFFKKICRAFPKKYQFSNKKVLFNLLLSNNKKIKILNKKFRNKNKHTDVLSFPFNKKQKKLKENYLGDIIISFNYMNKPKNLDNYEFKIKTIKIFIHGFLHLLGHDHQKSKEYKQMLNEEKKIFRSIEKTSILN